jgi:Transposase DDE domain
MSNSSQADRSQISLPDLEAIATQTGLVVRKSRKFSPAPFLQSLLSSVVTGLASFNQIAANLQQRTGHAMARQSLHQRFGQATTAFLIQVLQTLIQQRYQPLQSIISTTHIKRIIIEDSSFQVMPKANSKNFPAHGNHHGATAGVKIDFTYDLLSGNILTHTLHNAAEQDKTIGKDTLTEIRPGDLLLRDMGYFSLSEFDAVEQLNAFWITRLPLTIGVRCDASDTLEERLKRSSKDILDLEVTAGEVGKKCRLIAVRAAPEMIEARHQERRKKARKSGKTPCPKGMIRDGWHVILTNLTKDECSFEKIISIYRARWAVEIQFRAWKQSLKLTAALNRKSNEYHQQALVLAAMIAHQLGMKLAQRLGATVGAQNLSYEKLYDLLAMDLVKARDLAEACRFDPDPRHIMRDRRVRHNPLLSALNGLS